MEKITGSRKGGSQCEGCSTKWTVFRRKKCCFSCKNYFCHVCIIRRPDKKIYCKKCHILTATPLNKNDLLNLRSKDLVNYLTSKHISTSGCVEKEDLVNVLLKAVNGGKSPAHSVNNSGANSYQNSPTKTTASSVAEREKPPRRTGETCYDEDGIRIVAIDSPENGNSPSSSVPSAHSEIANQSEWAVVSGRVGNSPNPNTGESVDGAGLPSSAEDKMACTSYEAKSTDSKKEKVHRNLKLSDINSLEDLNTMTVKELKTLLMTNRTDYKGCIERSELVEKATRLWSDYTLSRKDLEKLSLEELCKICMDAPIECVLLECGHMATCMTCGKQLSECPLCRQYVVRCVRTFKV